MFCWLCVCGSGPSATHHKTSQSLNSPSSISCFNKSVLVQSVHSERCPSAQSLTGFPNTSKVEAPSSNCFNRFYVDDFLLELTELNWTRFLYQYKIKEVVLTLWGSGARTLQLPAVNTKTDERVSHEIYKKLEGCNDHSSQQVAAKKHDRLDCSCSRYQDW